MLLFGLLLAIAFQLLLLLSSMLQTFYPELVRLYIFFTLLLFFLYLLVQKVGASPAVLITIHLSALSAFSYFWANYGGMAGTTPSYVCVYIIFIVVCSSGRSRWIIFGLFALFLAVCLRYPTWLGMDSLWESHKIGKIQHGLNYLLTCVLIIAFALYVKGKLLYYHQRISQRSRQLNQIAQTLNLQNQQLAIRQDATRIINENLEVLVEQRTREAELKSKELTEYAFINAHMLREPLCRIIGILYLIENENSHRLPEHIAEIKHLTLHIDNHVREINRILS